MSTIQPAEMLDLEEIKSLTDLIRGHQRAIEEISTIRRNIILGVRNKRITYREIAAAMEVTEQSVYKILRPSIANAKAIAKAAEEEAKAAEETAEPTAGE
jgi:DNA-directed RNA polymerase specialized sigma24 family protein